MPILGTAIMDTERIIPQNGSSPGSGGSSNGGMNSNLQQSSHMMHNNSSNHIQQSQQLNYSQQPHGVNSGYHHQQYVNGHTTANMLQGGGLGQSPSPIQHQGNSNPNISSNSNLNATYSTMTGGGVGGGNIMRKKKSERTIVPLPPTSEQPLPNYNSSNGVVGGYGNALTTNAVTISNQNQFSSTNHAINVHGQTMSPSSHTGNNTTHPSYGGGSHNYNGDMNTSNSHQIQTKSGVIMSSNQVVSSGGIMNHAYTRDNSMMSQNNSQLHQQHMNATRLNTTADTTVSMQDDSDEMQEVIEVQILPQDDNWGENTTAVTANSELDYGSPGSFGVAGGASGLNVLDGAQMLSGLGNSGTPGGHGGVSASVVTGGIGNPGDIDSAKWEKGARGIETERGFRFRCRRHAGPLVAGLLSIFAFVSPILMVVLPKMNLGLVELSEKKENEFQVEVDGMLVSLAFKLFILAVGTWAVFFRRPRATLPRIQIYRALVCTLIVVFLTSFWLFYVRHLVRHNFGMNVGHKVEYRELVQFALNLVDSLLFVLILAVILMEIRHKQSQYYIKVVRSPDGESRGFPIGSISVQQAASTVLDKYYTTFPIYNPYLDRLIGGGVTGLRNRGKPGGPGVAGGTVKVYELDGPNGTAINDGNSTVVSVASKKGYSSHNERFYEEYEYEKKLKKRKARLVTAAEDAFTHIRRMQEHQLVNDKTPMESYEAAQAIFPTISRPLQKYLRVTRQQPRHTVESILQHLSLCLSYDMSPRAFLEKFLVAKPVLQNEREQRDVHSWALVSERLLYRDIQPGTIFQLRQGDISLLCSVERLPHFHVSEEIIDPNSNRFVLRLNSETSV